MVETNFRGLGFLLEILKEVLLNPEWALACLLFFGSVLVTFAAVFRFILYALQIGEERDRNKAGSVFWKTIFFAGLLYLVYVFMFQSIFPPELGLLGKLLGTLPDVV